MVLGNLGLLYISGSPGGCVPFSQFHESVLQMSLLIIPKFLSPTKGWLMNYLFYGSGLYAGFHIDFSCHRLCLLQTKRLPLLAGFSLNLPAILKNTFTSKLYGCRSHLNTGKSAARMSPFQSRRKINNANSNKHKCCSYHCFI